MELNRLAVGLVLGFGMACAAIAQTTMKISISTAQNSHQGVAIDTFAKEVEKRTGGRYKVQTFYNGSLGGERESIEAVQLGTQELAFSSTGPVPSSLNSGNSSAPTTMIPAARQAARKARKTTNRRPISAMSYSVS